MSGDIDIEEHDLMDNPRVRTIFPDLNVLKKEIVDADQEELQKKIIPNRSSGPSKVLNDSVITQIKEELETEECSVEPVSTQDKQQNSKKSLLHSNVIVFGTKPSQNADKKLKYKVRIYLVDINRNLKKSECYCRICKILFPKAKLLDNHNLLNHKETCNNKDSICVQKDKGGDSQITIINEENSKKCFHCREEFTTQELLIEHLYEVLNKKAKTQKNILGINNEVKSNDKTSLLVSTKKNVTKNTDKVKCGTTSADSNCSTETITVDEAISVEKEYHNTFDNQNEVFCDTSRDEAFQCNICSYYFQQQKFYEIHMEKKHETKVKQINLVKFNPKCLYCSNTYPTLKKYNAHLHKMHSSIIFNVNKKELNLDTKINETKESHKDNSNISLATLQKNQRPLSLESSYDLISNSPLLFKNILFKCIKCEIHFLSPKLATSHIIHSEILVNWKCSLCDIFFKRSDEDLHLTQHKYTESFTVLNVEDKDLDRIIIRCAKCSLHVPKSDFRQHLKVCGNILNPWHCSVCDINIEGSVQNKRAHNAVHDNMDGKECDFIIINDSIMGTHISSRESESMEVSTITSTVVEATGVEEDDYSPDESDDYLPINDLITNSKKSSLGSKSLVKNKSKQQNKSVSNRSQKSEVNEESIKETKLIKEQNKLKRKLVSISDPIKKLRRELVYKDDDYYSKFTYQPSDKPTFLLNMTYCENCECFINFFFKLDVHLEKRCHKLAKRVCRYCGIVLTPKLIIRHTEFHKLNPHLKLQDFRFYDIETCEQILPPMPIYPKCEKCEAHFLSHRDQRLSHVCEETPSNFRCDICEVKFGSGQALNLHIPFHGYYIQSKSLVKHNGPVRGTYAVSNESNRCRSDESTMDVDEPRPVVGEKSLLHTSQEDDIDDEAYNVEDTFVYTCEECNVTVCRYDQLVEHCHSHYNGSYKNVGTELCTECHLMFDRSFILSHRELHEAGMRERSFKRFSCDVVNFGCSNSEWLDHVFKSLPESKRETVLKYSLYKNEYRVKLDVAQQGDPELTLYQCTKCSIFIDDCDMFAHRKNCKDANRKFPCQHCGIALLSYRHRTRHLVLHEGRSLSIKSYRIVVFNRMKDKPLNNLLSNKTIQYLLYKCRNCQGVVEWRSMKNHLCDFDDLRKCNSCGLLICNEYYAAHKIRHRTADTFVASNMKVVMFGEIRNESEQTTDMACSFSGITVDYVLYKCIKCNVCIRHLRLSAKHHCLIEAGKWKCLKCDLFFDEGHQKFHRAMHASDADFTSDVICVVPFDPKETYQRLENESKTKAKNDRSDDALSIEEKTELLYRCPCGLHYLTEETAMEHVKKNKCGSISKKHQMQTCSKCNLNFTSEVLYKHLLQHHAEKYVKYSFDILNVGEQSQQTKSTKTTRRSRHTNLDISLI